MSRGETITFHLGFDPNDRGGSLRRRSEALRPTALTPGRETDWKVERSGAALVWTTAPGGRDASYALCLRVEAEQVSDVAAGGETGEMTVAGSLLVDGEQARLCAALAESFPPQCGEPSLVVENLDTASSQG